MENGIDYRELWFVLKGHAIKLREDGANFEVTVTPADVARIILNLMDGEERMAWDKLDGKV